MQPYDFQLDAADRDSPPWRHLVQLYLHDMSLFDRRVRLDAEGLYQVRWPGLAAGGDALIVYRDTEPIGFVVVRHSPVRHEVQQLFLVPAVRGHGLAHQVVAEATHHCAGSWHARTIEANERARRFWVSYSMARGGHCSDGLAQWDSRGTRSTSGRRSVSESQAGEPVSTSAANPHGETAP